MNKTIVLTYAFICSSYIISLPNAHSTSIYPSGGFVSSKKAQDKIQGGFLGPNMKITTVIDALETSFFDLEVPVAISGHINEALGDSLYLFSDKTGAIVVKISPDIWKGLFITPETYITIEGEIDNDFDGKTIDISSITKMK